MYMKKPTIRVGNFCFAIILYLIFLLPLNVYAQENSISPVTTETFPADTIIIPITASNQNLVPGKNIEITNSINLSQKESNPTGLLNEKGKDFITDTRTGQKYIKDRVIVRFKSQKNAVSSFSQEKISLAHAKVGARIQKDLSVGSVAGLQLIQLPNGTDVQSAIAAYESNPDVLYAEPDYALSIIPDSPRAITNQVNSATILSIPNDSDFSYQWDFNNTGQTGGTPGADINAPAAWNISSGSSNVIVAVIDTGVLYTHKDLSTNIWNNTDEISNNGKDDDHNGYIDDVRGWNFVNSTNDPIDDLDHGTHVSGTIGAVGNNGLGVAGVNWHVQIMPLKAFNSVGSGTTSDAIEAIRYANANGASVISNSWGGDTYSQSLKDAIDASPAVVVCAAGNSASNNDVFPVYPASYSSANIISVAATDDNDVLAGFSNYGLSSVHLAAPGTNIWSTYLDGNYSYKSGTSMATPHVSGVAALVKAVNSSLTSVQIKNILLSTVDAKKSLSGKVASGGRLNAYKAVLASNPLIANFTVIPLSGRAPLTVHFSDTSTGLSITEWDWSFGDGSWFNTTNVNLKNPMYTYGATGTYTARLTVCNPSGCNTTSQGTNITTMVIAPTKIGVYKDGFWYLDTNSDGVFNNGDSVYLFGLPGWAPVIGNWNGLGKTEIGVYKDGVWYLDTNGDGVFNNDDSVYLFGLSGWEAVVGDWNGDGKTEIGVYKDGVWYLDTNDDGAFNPGDLVYSYGFATWSPVVGNWNGLGKKEIGVYKDGMWYLDYNGNGTFDTVDKVYVFGLPGWSPVIGDWNGDGKTEIGVYKDGVWYLDTNGDGVINTGDSVYSFGLPGWSPALGDWNGDGKTEMGVYKDGIWYLDSSGDGVYGQGDRANSFGLLGWTSVVGKW
jgi:thermitase